MNARKKMQKGFTLIELLIVIGLLGALTALILPSLSADRAEALGDICDYNQAGTVRVLKQYNQITGGFPNDMHTGIVAAPTMPPTGAAEALANAMGGIPAAQDVNLDDIATYATLTTTEVASLAKAGITKVCSGTGHTSGAITATTTPFMVLTDAWVDDTPTAYTFDGQTLATWRAKTNSGTSNGRIIVLWITPTIDWETPPSTNNSWVKPGAVKIGIDLEGQCPIPTEGTTAGSEPDFSYYMAYFLVDSDDVTAADGSGIDAAKLIGTSCPECGVMNP